MVGSQHKPGSSTTRVLISIYNMNYNISTHNLNLNLWLKSGKEKSGLIIGIEYQSTSERSLNIWNIWEVFKNTFFNTAYCWHWSRDIHNKFIFWQIFIFKSLVSQCNNILYWSIYCNKVYFHTNNVHSSVCSNCQLFLLFVMFFFQTELELSNRTCTKL